MELAGANNLQTQDALYELSIESTPHPVFVDEKVDSLTTYVISLDRTPDRYLKAKQQLDDHGIKHLKFSAIDGFNVKITTEKNEVFSGKDLKEGLVEFKREEKKEYRVSCRNKIFNYITGYKHSLTPGELGVTCSHLEIWQDIANKHLEYALILEDDVILKPNAKEELSKVLNKLPNAWDMIFIHLYAKKQRLVDNKDGVLDKIMPPAREPFYSLAAYLVSYHGAKALLQNSKIFTEEVDIKTSNLAKERKIKVFKTKKEFMHAKIGEDPKDSIIYQMGRKNF